jgi:uncharacterized protein (TIGR02246 family)
LVFVVGFAVLVGGALSLGTAEDEAAIKRVIVAMTDGFNRHDAQAATAMYLADGEFVSARGEMAAGAADVAATLASMFATRLKVATLTTLDVKVRFIRPDVALVHVTNELSGLIGASGQTLPPHQELSLRVFVKDDDGAWRLAAFHNTLIAPPQ